MKAHETEKSPGLAGSLSSKLAIYAALPPSEVTLALIQEFLPWHLEEIYARAALSYGSENTADDDLITSCMNTSYVLAVMFFGEALAKNAFDIIAQEVLLNLYVQLPSKNRWQYEVVGLFDGGIIHNLLRNKNITDFPSEISLDSCYIEPETERFENFLQPDLKKISAQAKNDDNMIRRLMRYFSELSYDFNTATFSALTTEIKINKTKTTQNVSHVYFVFIATQSGHEVGFDHCFVIEQFQLPGCDKIRYRIYQSYINQATLLDDIAKRQYDRLGERSLTLKEINKFLRDTELLYSVRNKKHGKMNAEKCFGYKDTGLPCMFFRDSTLIGPSMRFFSSDVRPEQCPVNLMNFLETTDRNQTHNGCAR